MSTELNRKFSSLRPVFKDLVIKKAALKWNTTVLLENHRWVRSTHFTEEKSKSTYCWNFEIFFLISHFILFF